MDAYFDLVYWLNGALIRGLFISVLVVILFHWVLSDKVNTERASKIICWIILLYGIAALISQLLMFLMPPSEDYLWSRATGPYWWAFWIMIISHTVLPLTLLIIKSRRTIYFLFFLSLIMNAGWLFESFVIHVTSMHSGYITETYNPYLPNRTEQLIMLKGFVVGIVILIAANAGMIFSKLRWSRS